MKFNLALLILSLLISLTSLHTNAKFTLTIEEQRVIKAQQAMPGVNTHFDWSAFKMNWAKNDSFILAQQSLSLLGDQLWQFSKEQAQNGRTVDDRPLYWTRLAIISFVKATPSSFTESELTALVETFENTSRGRNDLTYKQVMDKRILLTGFDPFLLDRNIKQSNPSGLAALLLDGVVIEYQQDGIKVTAEINTAMIPVRYEDFDQGEVESLLAPFYALIGDEFVLFSLPYQAMMKAKGRYKINDNRGVTILESGQAKDITANSLTELADKVSVQGGGGGYLSNEISYRSISLRNKLSSTIPTGHIHTPRISGFDVATNRAIIAQIEAMLIQTLAEI